jgi:large subunit ribosomal protein L7A
MEESDSLSILNETEKIAGIKQVARGILSDTVTTVYLATDCDSFIENKIMSLTKDKIKVIKKYTQKQLGEACNIDVGAAVVGVLKH